MNADSIVVMQGLLKKLSAVRMTLSDEERALLDQLIEGSQVDVEAHAKAFSPDAAKAMDADEVVAHTMPRVFLGHPRLIVKVVYDPNLETYKIID